MKTLQELLNEGIEELKKACIEDAKIDAWYLMEYAFSINRMQYMMKQDKIAQEETAKKYMQLILKRSCHIPLQHITGQQEFMGYPFLVNQHVLIPRQDTEILVEEVLKQTEQADVLDMCTGSGCIIVALEKMGKLNRAVGADISEKALEVAKTNGIRLETNVEWIQSNLFEQVTGQYDIIVSNPPYIESKEIDLLMPEVKDHEPLLALDGHADGLYFYQTITRECISYLKENGMLYYEIGYNQGNAVKEILESNGFTNVHIIKDLTGLDRVVYGRRE